MKLHLASDTLGLPHAISDAGKCNRPRWRDRNDSVVQEQIAERTETFVTEVTRGLQAIHELIGAVVEIAKKRPAQIRCYSQKMGS